MNKYYQSFSTNSALFSYVRHSIVFYVRIPLKLDTESTPNRSVSTANWAAIPVQTDRLEAVGGANKNLAA